MDYYKVLYWVLLVSGPICLTMLNDALKGENLEEELEIKDISEMVQGRG